MTGRGKLRTTDRARTQTNRFEQSILCILYAAEPRSLTLSEIESDLRRKSPADIAWALNRMMGMGMVERGTDPSKWQLTPFGRKVWGSIVELAAQEKREGE